MTGTIFLVRHAAHVVQGERLVGRMAGISLGEVGRRQADALGRRLSDEKLSTLLVSPSERAQQTARAIRDHCPDLACRTDARLDEVDFGEAWTGKTFGELDGDPDWQLWNADRGRAATPGGETMGDIQLRVVSAIADLLASNGAVQAALVTHAEIIKAAICHVLRLPLSNVHRFDIDTGSITAIAWGGWGAKLLWLNERIA